MRSRECGRHLPKDFVAGSHWDNPRILKIRFDIKENWKMKRRLFGQKGGFDEKETSRDDSERSGKKVRPGRRLSVETERRTGEQFLGPTRVSDESKRTQTPPKDTETGRKGLLAMSMSGEELKGEKTSTEKLENKIKKVESKILEEGQKHREKVRMLEEMKLELVSYLEKLKQEAQMLPDD